jgi:hypothetical protein
LVGGEEEAEKIPAIHGSSAIQKNSCFNAFNVEAMSLA